MQGGLALHAAEVGVHGNARNPGEPITGENQGPGVAILSGHARIDQYVLQLARASSAGGAHAQPWAAESKSDIQVSPQMSRIRIVTPVTRLDL